MELADILTLFGTLKARENFLRLCRLYYGERVRQEAAHETGHPALNSRRAETHTEIMLIVQKLYVRRQEPMPSRKEMGEMIMRHMRAESNGTEFNHTIDKK